MTALPALTTIVNGTPNDATPVDGNFDLLATHIDDELINRDGSLAMSGELTLSSSTPSGALVAASKGYVDTQTATAIAVYPPGSVSMYAGSSAPTGFLLCQGQNVSRATYADLFAAIGTNYGTGDGSSTFGLPDLRSKFPVGLGTASWSNALNETGGSSTAINVSHTHTMPTHIHTMPTHFHTMPSHSHGAGTYTVDLNHNHASFSTGSISAIGSTPYDVLRINPGGSSSIALAAGSQIAAVRDLFTDTSHVHVIDVPPLGTTNEGVTGSSQSVDPGDTNAKDPGDTNSTDPGDTNSSGSSGTNANLPPYITLNFIIKT